MKLDQKIGKIAKKKKEILGNFKKSTPTYSRKCPRIDHILTFKLKVITKRKMSKNSKND